HLSSAQASHGDEVSTATAKKAQAAEKIGRNDPCPCGSGKKYKNCCGRH
ncbi:SEC-C metal-binding domain-containing protein, partial [Selenomonas sp. AE3005]